MLAAFFSSEKNGSLQRTNVTVLYVTNRVSLPFTLCAWFWCRERRKRKQHGGYMDFFFHFPSNWTLVSVLSRPSFSSTMQKYKNENKEMTKKQWKHWHYIWEVFCTCGRRTWLKINPIISSLVCGLLLFSPSATKCTIFTSSVSSFMDDVLYTLSCAALVLHHACL